MKNDLTCGVVRDLLPSYVENLLSEESREAVDRHLENCQDCTARKNAMSAPAEEEETAKEVDFLKRVKKRTFKKIALAVVCTAAVLLGAFALKIFVIGTPLQPQSVAVMAAEVHEDDNSLYLSLSSTGSGNAFHSWKVETEDGVASIYARDVLVSSLYRSAQKELEVPLKDVREVWLGGVSGRLIWQDGVVITRECLDLLALRTPYCGDAPALGKIAQALNLGERLGNYTTELQTASQPYGWTLVLDRLPDKSTQWNYIVRCEYLMLALVDNLSFVSLKESDGESGNMQEMSLENANRVLEEMTALYNQAHGTSWTAKASVKDYTHTPADFQRMLNILDYYYYPEGGRDAARQ